jgi:hypothetical protein
MTEIIPPITKDSDILWNLYMIGSSCMDTITTLVFETETHKDVSFGVTPKQVSDQQIPTKRTRRFLIFDSLRDKTGGSSADVLVSAEHQGKHGRRKSVSQSSPPKVPAQLSDLEVHTVMPILAELTNSIFLLFEKIPLSVTESDNITLKTPVNQIFLFSTLKSECASFLSNCVLTTELDPDVVKLWNRILRLMKMICDFNEKQMGGLDLPGLEEIVSATERVLKNAPRYTKQACEMSPKSEIALRKAQMISFVDRLMIANQGYEHQRAIKRDDELKNTMEQIWSASKRRMMNQCFEMTKKTEIKMKYGAMEHIIEIQDKNQFSNQVLSFLM